MAGLDSPILVTGVPRSGTSMTSGLIHQAGAWGGDMFGSTPDNVKGFFENKKLREDITKGYLVENGIDPMGQKDLPSLLQRMDFSNEERTEKLASDVKSIIQQQGYKDGPWFYKGAKISLMWGVWAAAFPFARWVLIRRKTEGIVSSCIRTGFMRVHSNSTDWTSWVEEYEAGFEQMRFELCPHELWYEDIVEGRWDGLQTMIQDFDLSWEPEKILDFII